MRTSVDLVNELFDAPDIGDKEVSFRIKAIAVGYEAHTEWVMLSSDKIRDKKDVCEELNNKIMNGGEPIGIVQIIQIEKSVQGHAKVFEEFQNEQWAHDYLHGLCENVGGLLKTGDSLAKILQNSNIKRSN